MNPWHSPSEERFLHEGLRLPPLGSRGENRHKIHSRLSSSSRVRCTDSIETSRSSETRMEKTVAPRPRSAILQNTAMPFLGCLDTPKAPVRIPVEFPPQESKTHSQSPINMVYCYRSGFPFSRRALSLQHGGERDSLSWLLDAKFFNPCALNFRGTPSVGFRTSVPLSVLCELLTLT